MTLQRMRAALKAEVRAAKHAGRFVQARSGQAAFEQYIDIGGVLAALEERSSASYDEKERLLRALIDEQQRRPHPFWSAVLVLACYPMLVRLQQRARHALPREEFSQLLVAVFLDAVAAFRLASWRRRTFLQLRYATQRRLFAQLGDREREAGALCLKAPLDVLACHEQQRADERGGLWPEMLRPEVRAASEQKPQRAETSRLVIYLLEYGGSALDSGKLELVVATMIRGEPLTDYVDRAYADVATAERRQLYQRLKRCHSRTIRGLRDALAEKTHADEQNVEESVSPN